MLIADTHSDTLFSMNVAMAKESELCITPKRLRQGGVGLQTFALWSGPMGRNGDFDAIANAEMKAALKLEAAGLRRVDDPSQAKDGECCFMLSLEGCELFERGLTSVEAWREKGIRMGALVWNNPNAIAFPAKGGSTQGITAFGIRIVKEMQRVHMAVDTSHLNEAGFYDLFAKTDVPPMASHSCCRALCDHFRNLTDDQLRLMIREGGYVGVNFYPYFLDKEGHADVETVVNHIDHICQMGGEKCVGFGSDFDGIECTPKGLEHPGKIGALIDALRRRGYAEEAIEGIAGQNLLAYFQRI